MRIRSGRLFTTAARASSPFSKLVFGDYPLPPLGDRDVLVKNHAGSVSRWDVKYRAGDLSRYQLPGRAPFPLPQQLGREAAGEVVAAGRAVTRFKPGDP
jgi:NADPH:quinone reductase-like Zn-dependent oxidoreductase